MKNKLLNSQTGFIALMISIVFLAVMLVIASSISFLAWRGQKTIQNVLRSSQSFYAAEAGIEDALVRLSKGMSWSSPYSFNVDGSSSTLTISDVIGGARTISSTANRANRIRKIEAVYTIDGEEIHFFFGAQVGAGGLTMSNSSIIDGNVFSNGNITAIGGGGQRITGDAIVAGNGNRIEGILVSDYLANGNNNVQAHSCKDSVIDGILTYVAGGSAVNCTAGGGIQISPNQIDFQPLPISDSQINNWKSQAETGGVYNGDYTLAGTAQASIGPLKIVGNLILSNSARLTLAGTIWVTGNVSLNNSSILQLDSAGYGTTSGVLVADGIVGVNNSAIVQGTGQPGSYLMLLTTSPANPAMSIGNSATAGVFYASQGVINISNSAFLREVTAYGLTLGNSVIIQYDVGMANLFFTSGPSGGWEVAGWKEVE